MKDLEKEFTGRGSMKGFVFTRIRQGDFGYIYEVRSGGDTWYEVFKKRITKASDAVMGGELVHFEERVIYPADNAFGVWAWSCNDLMKAERYFEVIRKEYEKYRAQN